MLLLTNLILAALLILYARCEDLEVVNNRPAFADRKFTSTAIDSLISNLVPLLKDENIALLFQNCLPNTLDTTVSYFNGDPTDLDAFIITGDIEALWLRDSSNQVMPYIPYISNDDHLRRLIEGLVDRHARSVLIDPFANSFNYNASGEGHQDDVRAPPMSASVFEGKYEIDSLNSFMKLSYWYWRYSSPDFSKRILSETWMSAVDKAVETIEIMQTDNGASVNPPYLFQRMTTQASDTLLMSGRGPPAKLCGLSRSLFRPSDDAVALPYNVPGNAMACTELKHTEEILEGLATSAAAEVLVRVSSVRDKLCGALKSMINNHTKAPLPYEVDGFGSEYFMDDANIPSLLSLPLLGTMKTGDPIYSFTRSYVLSSSNPYWFKGTVGDGIGGPHVGYNYIWPMSIITRAMTSTDKDEITYCLRMLADSSAGTGFMHESFNKDDVNDYTREWFAWANGLFGELILQLVWTHPELVLKDGSDVVSKAQSIVLPTISMVSMNEASL